MKKILSTLVSFLVLLNINTKANDTASIKVGVFVTNLYDFNINLDSPGPTQSLKFGLPQGLFINKGPLYEQCSLQISNALKRWIYFLFGSLP